MMFVGAKSQAASVVRNAKLTNSYVKFRRLADNHGNLCLGPWRHKGRAGGGRLDENKGLALVLGE